jgi:DNA-binding winged helix-turn-helix (wHTH) protein
MGWPSRVVSFAGFRFDPSQHRLWRGAEEIVLRPKATALLSHLLRHPGELVTKQQLLDAVWSDTSVSDAVLKVSISEIRRALGGGAHGAPLIETRHGRGYRLTVPVDAAEPRRSTGVLDPPLVARESALAALTNTLALAVAGERQTVLITGEAGLGKTALVEVFGSVARAEHDVWVACGHAVRNQGPEEPFEPVLEALNHLSHQAGPEAVGALLKSHAPTWLMHLPWASGSVGALGETWRASEPARARMLREMAEAVVVLSAEKPLVLVLEDLHRADCSTLDLIAFMARPREPARILVVGTSHPFASLPAAHPLRVIKQELHVHRRCTELQLAPLGVAEVAIYLETRLPGGSWPPALVERLHHHTEGNPLFVTGLVDDLLRRDILQSDGTGWRVTEAREIDTNVPDLARELILMNLEDLATEDRRILDAASIVGREFSAAIVAALLGEDALTIEERCEQLARGRHYLQPASSVRRPDGRMTARFRFVHGFTQQVLSQELVPRMRMRFQQRARQYHAGAAHPHFHVAASSGTLAPRERRASRKRR